MYFANPGDNGGVPQIRRGIPLRVGLVAATLLLVGCGLLASGVAVTTIMHHTLINRVDDTLRDASRGWAQVPRQSPADPEDQGPNPGRPPSDYYVRVIEPGGTAWVAVNDRDAEPALPRSEE